MYGAEADAKAMKDMAEPVFVQLVRPTRKYYEFRTDKKISDREPMVKTSDQFTDGQLNIKLVDDVEWKLDLYLFMVAKKNYEKDHYALIENRDRAYNLVLQHYPPNVEAGLKNQLTWTAGQDK